MMEWQIVFTGPEQAELRELPVDEAPLGATEVLGRTLFTAVSPGTETAVYVNQRAGTPPSATGYAAVFEVTAVGAEVKSVRPGRVCFAMAPHRSLQRLPEQGLIPLPTGLAAEQAPLARLMNVTMSTLTTTTARPPGKVLVTGLGIVGLLGAQVFRAAGYEVHACEPDDVRRGLAEKLGFKHLYKVPPQDDPVVTGQVELVLECSGHENAALAGCHMVRKRGEVVLVGVPWFKKSELTAHELLHAIFHKYAVVRSGWEWEVPRQPTDFQVGSMQANLRAALEWLAEGKVTVAGLYDVMAPGDCQAIYQGLMQRTLPRPAVVLDWGQV